MSRYVTVKTIFRDGDALLCALAETGKWTMAQIEVHDTAQYLYGVEGKKRKQTANIIIRRQYVGPCANDIGFVQDEDGNYRAIISEYDSGRYGKTWLGQLKGNYAYHKLRRDQEARGRTVMRTRCQQTGTQRVEITGYR